MSADSTHPSTHLILAEQHFIQAVGYLVAAGLDADEYEQGWAKAIAVRARRAANDTRDLRARMSPSLTELLGAEPAENCS